MVITKQEAEKTKKVEKKYLSPSVMISALAVIISLLGVGYQSQQNILMQ